MTQRKLNVGAIGIGGIFSAHVDGWKNAEHAQLAAGADLNEEVLSKWGEEHGVTKLYTDPQELIADPDIDIVDICTPSSYHAPLAIAALEAGKHVLCEKPLAPTPEDIRKMIEARDKSGKQLMTAQHMRFFAKAQAMKREVQAGKLGDIYHARCWYLRRNQLPTGPGFIYKKNAGGGPCIDIGVHVLDLTLWLMGNPRPVSVTGVSRKELAGQPGAWSSWGGKVPADMDVEDFAAGFVRFENGATLNIEVSWMLHHPATEEKIWLYGTEGGATYPDCTLYKTDNQLNQTYDISLGHMPQPHPPHNLECMELARMIAEGGGSPVPAEQSLQVQTILNGLYKSAEAGAEVRLD